MSRHVTSGPGHPATVTVTATAGAGDTIAPNGDYGIYMDHPESRERLQAALDKLKKRNIKVERKHSLALLRTAFRETPKHAELTIDGYAVWGGRKTPEVRAALKRARTTLDRDFQMELAPYDLRLEGDRLYIGNKLLARGTADMDDMATLRKNLMAALDRARRQHPVAKYFQKPFRSTMKSFFLEVF